MIVGANSPKTGVLLLAHGSPEAPSDVPEFLLQVTGGRPLPGKVVEEVQHRYALIGASPLHCWTLEQRDMLARDLSLPVYVGMRNWKPFIAETVRSMEGDGIGHAVAICMAPQNSRTSVGLYRTALTSNRELPFSIDFIESWHDQSLLIRAFAERLLADWQEACAELKQRVPIIFTAHSVPSRTIVEGDPYETQAKQTAALVADAAGLARGDWRFAFQSQGMSGGEWLGPTVESTILELKENGQHSVFIHPIGFLCDHVEVLYDIDIAFKGFAEQHQMQLRRARSLNDSPLLTAALAQVVRSRLT